MNQETSDSKICPICGRLIHKESKYCIFHASAEEKTEKEFKKALKEYVNKIKEADSDYVFYEFIFVGEINFKKDLSINTFKKADFKEATFRGGAYFNEAIFKGNASFDDATFKGNSSFIKATFEGEPYFDGATFIWGASFDRATFEGNAYFELKYLFKDLTFSRTKAFPVKKWSININSGIGIISFENAYLENVNLDIELAEGVLVNFTDTLLRNTKINKDKIKNHILQEKEKKHSEAQKIYLLLKNNFHSIGQYEDENWAFKKEKDKERKSNCHFKTLHKWFWSCFLNGIFGYGIQPSKVIILAILIITLFAFFLRILE